MKMTMNVLEAKGPIAWAITIAIVVVALFGSISLVEGPSDAKTCIDKGGSWSHTLAQRETQSVREHYDDKCALPGAKP